MIDLIYIEEALQEHPRAREICARFPGARLVRCGRYGEVFNPKAQNFRLQKQRPALILAHKHAGYVQATPPGYGIGGSRNYYFSHMLNCVYDCRYCFLQGMYRSAHYVLFVNYEDFADAMEARLEEDGESWFFSGYDCDSLALEPVTGFAGFFLRWLSRRSGARMELRTKSTQIRCLLRREASDNVVTAFSFTPDKVSRALELRVPDVAARIEAMRKLQQAGWRIGLRFDPLIFHADYKRHYRQLFSALFARIDADAIHSVTLGAFRMPSDFFRNLLKRYPEISAWTGRLERHEALTSYPVEIEQEMVEWCTQALREYVPADALFPHRVMV